MDKALKQADLNLLKVLQVLLEERNVTRTADKLFVSQSAISKSLRRLRELFDDPLLVRSPHGLMPTLRAMELAVPINEAMSRLDGLWKAAPFNPAAAQGRLRIAAPESFVLGISSWLVLRLHELAPHLSVEFLHLDEDYLKLLAAGSLDFAINLDQPYPLDMRCKQVVSEAPMLWMSVNHPLSGKQTISLVDVCSYPSIRFHSPNVTKEAGLYFNREIGKHGLVRTDFASTSHLLIALDMLTKSEAIMMAPKHLSLLPAFKDGIVAKAVDHIPAFKKTRMRLVLVYHERTENSALHQWVSAEIQKGFSIMGRKEALQRTKPS